MFQNGFPGMLGGGNPMADPSQGGGMPQQPPMDNPLMGQQPQGMSPLMKQMLMMKMMQQGQGGQQQNDPSSTAGLLANIAQPTMQMLMARKFGMG